MQFIDEYNDGYCAGLREGYAESQADIRLEKDRFLTQYNKAINKYRKRVRRNDMGGWIGINDIPFECLSHTKLPCGCPKPRRIPNIQCVLNTPLYMVIPPDGVHLSCPAHPEGHRVFGSQVRY